MNTSCSVLNMNRNIIVILGSILYISLIISCRESNSKNDKLENFIEQEVVEPKEDDALIDQWYKDSIREPDSNLIRFFIIYGHREENEEIGSKLLWFSEKDSNKTKYSDIEIEEFTDSIKVSFWANSALSCRILGNMQVSEETLQLQHNVTCAPTEVGVTEGGVVNLNYVIKNSKFTSGKKLEIMEIDLRKHTTTSAKKH